MSIQFIIADDTATIPEIYGDDPIYLEYTAEVRRDSDGEIHASVDGIFKVVVHTLTGDVEHGPEDGLTLTPAVLWAAERHLDALRQDQRLSA